MAFYFAAAYDLRPTGFDGPSWKNSVSPCFEISAKLPAGATSEQFRLMLQNLLVERFHLSFHHETRMLSSSSLVVAKGGPKLKALPPAFEASKPGTGIPWAVSIVSTLHAPVADETGLTGFYEFTLDFLPPDYPSTRPPDLSAGDPVADSASALQSQLGLKLNTPKASRDVIVIDHIDQTPTDN